MHKCIKLASFHRVRQLNALATTSCDCPPTSLATLQHSQVSQRRCTPQCARVRAAAMTARSQHGPRKLQQTWTTGADVALRVWSLLGAAVAENSVKSEALRLQLITNNAIELPPARSLLHTPLLDLSHATPATQPLHPKLEPWGPPVFVHRLQVPSPRRLSATRATGVPRSSCLPSARPLLLAVDPYR